jgi:hypothetical protein
VANLVAGLAATAALGVGIKNHKVSRVKRIQGTTRTDDNLVDRETSRSWLPGWYQGPHKGGLWEDIKNGDFLGSPDLLPRIRFHCVEGLD